MDFAPGDRVDRYVLVQPLGEGGQGSVWRAEDPLAPGQPRAIKLVPLVLARPNDVERVRREARALAKLEHASLVRCHALFEDLKHSALGVVMDFVDGTSLRAAADEPWMTDQHRVAALRHIARALSYVHQEGVVHRDLKLDNVLVRRAFWDAPEKAENIKLVDFGIAKVSDGSHALTAVDTIVGTLAYLSPELLDPAFFKSNGATEAADVFAFGVLAWKLLVGGHPTGLPAGAGIVDYGAAYRALANRELPWPADAPPGAWGTLLSDCLRVRAPDRIADGRLLAERCEKAGDFSKTGAFSAAPSDPLAPIAERGPTDPTAEPMPPTAALLPRTLTSTEIAAVDALAPTVEIGPAGARSEPAPSPDRAARARAITERQPALTRRRERESMTDGAVVKHVELSAPPKAETQLSEPLPEPSRGSAVGVALIALGALLLVAIAVVVAVPGLFRPKADPPQPLVPTASHAPTGTAGPLATAAIPAPEAAAEDAPNDAVIESPTRPPGCSADQPICECCPSGRDCSPGRCDDDLNPMDQWHLRLGSAVVDGTHIGNPALNVELCVRIARFKDLPKCTMLNTPDAVNTQLFGIQGTELQGHGIEVELKSPIDGGGRTLKAMLKPKLTRIALCNGIQVDQFRTADTTSPGTAKVSLFLDDPTNPPQSCSPRQPDPVP